MKISEKARTLLAEEYERHGKYPTYAQQAMTSDAEFTMCSLRAIERALAPAQQVPGGGWKLVPVDPTEEMRDAFHEAHDEWEGGEGESPDHQWRAMLAAAPQPPAGGDVEVLVSSLERFESDGEDFVRLHDVRDIAAMMRAHVTARDQQITALQARVAELEADLKREVNSGREIAKIADKFMASWKSSAEQVAALKAQMAQQVTKHD